MKNHSWRIVVSAIASGLLVAPLIAAEPVDYLRQIKPILHERCYACHGALKQEASLRLDTAAQAVKGGDTGAAIEPSNAVGSLLFKRVSSADASERMPPEGEPLSAAQIKLIETWIAEGAKAPAAEEPQHDPRDHWAFKTPLRPAVPQVAQADWTRNPIDAFIAAEWERRGLKPQGVADKRVWLRRVYLDLIGLPPTRAELDAFVADQSPQAYDNVAMRLLDSPQYGERWGQHWMDIWRYSDWWGLGAEVRNSQKHIWHWRDWIIESVSADKGYDQMLLEMLAADELYPNDLDRLRASGFLARQYFKFNRTLWLDETIEHTSKAMLGLTFNCAKCHDHKYDPISQADYYHLRAIFEPYQVRTDQVPGESDYERDGLPRAFDCHLDAQTFRHIRGDDRNPDTSLVMAPTVPGFLSVGAWKVEPVTLPPESYEPGLRPFVVENYLHAAAKKIDTSRSALATARQKLATAELADKQAAEQAAQRAAAEKRAADAPPLVKDDFAADRPEVWEQQGGKWAFGAGKLVQSQDGATRAALRLKQMPPENFEARLRFRATGGQVWKSVGISFDVVEANESLAYVSAHLGQPKSQIAYKTGENYVYPPQALQNRKIELNQPYELSLRVQGTLVNLLINGELSAAYRLPVPRRRGAMQVITYDATAEFSDFELRELPSDVVLSEAKAEPKAASKGTESPPSAAQARLAVAVAEKAMAAAEAEPAAIRARAAAEKAGQLQPPPANAAALAREAVRLERIVEVAKAEEAAAQAELDVLRAAAEKNADKKADAEKKLAAAKTALDTARQAAEKPGENFTPLGGSLKTLESNLEKEDSRRKPFPHTSTGRRTAFAKWLIDPKNPLTARVAVNHIWMRHLGQPLVPTVFDFGHKGTPPTHPQLLDWLAVELVEHGWSMKHIHRLIVTSQTYRLSSSASDAAPETLARDPDNRYYWRANPVRVEAEVVRDSLLYLAGELDLTQGGPPVPINDEASRRRSLYFLHSHNDEQKFLSMFDAAGVQECYRRAESIVPQQALALENSQLTASAVEKIAQRIAAATPGAADREFIRAAFLTVLSVEPTEAEQGVAAAGLARLTEAARRAKRPDPEVQARRGLIHALVNHNDFITVR